MKRPVVALDLPDLIPGAPPTPRPEITWIDPGELLIDEQYQRGLSDASLKLIRRIVEGWDWRRLKPPIAAWTDEGLEVIDGQHTAIAAATHPGIETIPVVIVEAIAQVDRAQAFVGHNKDRLVVTAAQIHHALVTAGDAEALEIARVCEAADVTVLRLPPARAVYRPRTTIAVAAVRALVTLEEEPAAVWVLRTLADAGLAPIAASHIRALQHLINDGDFAEVDRDALARAVVATPIKAAEQEAKEHAAVHCVPTWRGLAVAWFKAAKKLPRRKPDPARGGGGEPDAGNPAPERDQALGPVASERPAGAGPAAPGNPIPDSGTDPRRRRHAEMVEAARRAVPAPTFSRPGGATVRTG